MYSIAFPNFLTSNGVSIIKDKEATLSNMNLLLSSWKTSLFGDPYFGTNLKKLIFDRNNRILQDIVIDDILNAITNFMPQIRVQRKDITAESSGSTLYINIKAQNLLDYSFDNYTIKMLNIEEI